MVFHVDNFLVGKPGTTNKYRPFVIGTVDGVSRVSMDSAFIQDAAIINAKIANLTVQRIKLASGASNGLSWGSGVTAHDNITVASNSGVWYDLSGMSISIATESYGRVLITAMVECNVMSSGSPTLGHITCRLVKNGTVVAIMNTIYIGIRTNTLTWIDTNPIDGTSTYKIQYEASSPVNPAGYIQSRSMSAVVFYR
jgi:hypothetical protein